MDIDERGSDGATGERDAEQVRRRRSRGPPLKLDDPSAVPTHQINSEDDMDMVGNTKRNLTDDTLRALEHGGPEPV